MSNQSFLILPCSWQVRSSSQSGDKTRSEFGGVGKTVALLPYPRRQGHPAFLLVFSCDVAGAVDVPSLTPGIGDTLYYCAAVCLWAESPPES